MRNHYAAHKTLLRTDVLGTVLYKRAILPVCVRMSCKLETGTIALLYNHNSASHYLCFQVQKRSYSKKNSKNANLLHIIIIPHYRFNFKRKYIVLTSTSVKFTGLTYPVNSSNIVIMIQPQDCAIIGLCKTSA